MKPYYAFILLFLFVAGCTKFGKNVTIKGRVMNPITGQGIEGAEIWLQKTAGGYDGGWKTVKTATSGSDGTFELNKLGLAGYSAVCGKFSGDYYELGWTQDDGVSYTGNFKLDVKKGKTMHADYYAVPYGSLTLNIKNTSCFNSFDNIKIYFDGGPYDSRTFNPGLMTSLDGCIDIPGSPVKSSMGYKYFHWEVTKNSVTTTYYDTVFVNEGLTTILNVNY
ncbi:carboxypeptidase-like regulatory domain-containing protein [Fluviicola chungangensis]|uniref:Carboxypeptidase regulatory-like domain-containing protein n=1 Tax=Fluviicola chungangensis TaxID=2597671 RepID=A0A556MJE7_9FLAO|nr:carboxypeptidase-like regulatory domain-containing protein [Fluviicola chungangensis]TSJ39996.1 carboxypeptidase regulatory-like domain-containing protein [Fluviicola chungangensis]